MVTVPSPAQKRKSGKSSLVDLLCAADGCGQIIVCPRHRALGVAVKETAVELFHIGVECRHTVFAAEADPQRRAGHFERGVDQG